MWIEELSHMKIFTILNEINSIGSCSVYNFSKELWLHLAFNGFFIFQQNGKLNSTMFNQKITFGKIQLNIKKDKPNDANKSEEAAEVSGIYLYFLYICCGEIVVIVIKMNNECYLRLWNVWKATEKYTNKCWRIDHRRFGK